MAENTYVLYRHTFPNGKVYIGITGGKPEKRWQNGRAYQSNEPMFRDIIKYGWQNIVHEILYCDLSEAEAKEKERELIQSFGVDGKHKTYNVQHIVPKPIEWKDCFVNEWNIRDYQWRFHLLNDDWLEYYQDRISQSIHFDLSIEGVELHTIRDGNNDAGALVFEDWILRYPRLFMSFREVYDWLQTHPAYELINKRIGRRPTVFPILKEE